MHFKAITLLLVFMTISSVFAAPMGKESESESVKRGKFSSEGGYCPGGHQHCV
ncbi:uncharacterized protein FA14DRAFT_161941 [Meira miltonrushii]|uniref:Uncharacterized protein n=1 Tax=Meira miltonrushii TaxID=1280837 RepID=A0A316V6B1_9BASI|nr:uncharacterized protein FA14DRAFT_161941 [Meira miltonrushii]PWN32558.1 hypothetical protein FA14DRAFT_161941 [Meira miltonrushii]